MADWSSCAAIAMLWGLAAAGGGCGEPFSTSGGAAGTGGSATAGGAGGSSTSGGAGGEGATGGAAGAGGSVASACPGFGPLDDGFETGTETPLGEWTDNSDSGTADYSTERWLAGSHSLVMRETDTSHGAESRVMVTFNLEGRQVDSLRVFNIASATVPSGDSNCAAAYAAIELTDGVEPALFLLTAYSRPYCGGSSEAVYGNEETADGTLVGADGYTWYEYCIPVPGGFDPTKLRLRLIAEADGGDLGIQTQIESFWDVVQALP